MTKAIFYYSLSGTVKAYAEKQAAETGADLFEIREERKYRGFTAFLFGCPKARGLKGSKIFPPEADLSSFDEIVIMGPIWAGRPAPAVNSMISLLPAGRSVSLVCISGSGGNDLSKTAALITERGCTVKEAVCHKR